MHRRVARRLPLLAVFGIVAVAFPLGALASHQFSDVPTTSSYHADIAAIADAGVTTGCGGGKYCPTSYVTREQMAAFMNRLGALGAGKTPVVNADKVDGLTSSQFARSDQVVAGTYNCPGHTMIAGTSSYDYITSLNAIWLASPGIAAFYCPILLPDGATVTSLSVGLRDNTDSGSVSCDLLWYPRLVPGAQSQLGFVNTTLAATPGDTILVDSTISPSTIDNDTQTYNLHCQLFGPADGDALALFGATIAYETSGIPVD